MSTGLTLDSILDMSFEQIELAARCVQKNKIDTLNMVFEPIAAAFGVKKKSSHSKRKSVSSTKNKTLSKEEKEAKYNHKLNQLALLGIGVRDI
tara:strand:+ start:220 stop:498 length:279 start_codon:yes stop_codon:yes gene_type:complete